MDLTNTDGLRDFLRLCLDPGPGRDKRTPARLASVLPKPVADALAEHAPYLEAFRSTDQELTSRAEGMHTAYAAALLAWVRDELPTDHALGLVEEGTAHVRACSWCTTDGVLSATCDDGRRLAAAFLAPTPEAPAEAAAVLGHATVEETTAVYTEKPDEAEEAPPVPVLPWVDLLRGDEPHHLLGELALALHHGQAPREDETTAQRARRTLRLVDTALATWRDAVDHREPAAYRTSDGRVWTIAGGTQQEGASLYESPTAPVRYTAEGLHHVYDGRVAVHIEDAPPAEPQPAPTRAGIALAHASSELAVLDLAEVYTESGCRDSDAQRYAREALAKHARRLAAALRQSDADSPESAARWLETYAHVVAPAED